MRFSVIVPTLDEELHVADALASVDTADAGPIKTPVGDDGFVVIEKWQSMDHLKAHAASDHMKAYGAKVKDMLASRVIHVLSAA